MGKTTGLGLCVLLLAGLAVFLTNGWYVDVGEWAAEFVDWFMDRGEQQSTSGG